MRLTTKTDYALRLLMYVAQQRERLSTIAEIATAYDISEAHLMKVTHQLATHGLIVTLRGKGGGMRLAREPADINLGAVVRCVEPDFQLVECFGESSGCLLTGRCHFSGILNDALGDFLARLDRHTLADILPPSPVMPPAPPAPRARAGVRYNLARSPTRR